MVEGAACPVFTSLLFYINSVSTYYINKICAVFYPLKELIIKFSHSSSLSIKSRKLTKKLTRKYLSAFLLSVKSSILYSTEILIVDVSSCQRVINILVYKTESRPKLLKAYASLTSTKRVSLLSVIPKSRAYARGAE